MKNYAERPISCPHCGGHIQVPIDTTQGNQDFYDDCPACCHPIHLSVQLDEVRDKVDLTIDADDEQIF
ncbi:molybdopterin-guanine dinucleotide biosynthesis protein A [Vibrio sp. UCD-FRSSP16_10]|uniref:CPXCG motif-containing cysteine-rich protein n=1 Tax=unclassified Vibrio TaxID=2614977 RepID=UPI0008023466|nr:MULTISPECIES: CPXCG motif-containing cysteine-rich protein [unclassified Vibrio]OBT12164.1 molybdopterin-guanine dinucleotide biosynthesis protein A [Vibrio sp. UCD-FRSSP16_30]OBT20495.1 molybdopterin-guanine dinucleotide biosynthesis protein A [Vibrio sp. UCD-FRSSP16_10]